MQVHPRKLRKELEAAAAEDLGNLRKEMIGATSELPGLTTKSAFHRMAIAFEAGRRCGVQQAIETATNIAHSQEPFESVSVRF